MQRGQLHHLFELGELRLARHRLRCAEKSMVAPIFSHSTSNFPSPPPPSPLPFLF